MSMFVKWIPWLFPLALIALCGWFYVATHEAMALVMAVLIAVLAVVIARAKRGSTGGGGWT